MARHDHYGTHDERGRGPARTASERARDERSAMKPHAPHGPNYGTRAERDVRTSGGDDARFQGRDYERENYGGGYGRQRKTRDVAAAGRKGGWMRGQSAGNGLDGLASERAFGSDNDHQMSAMDPDAAYRRWRAAELEAHDDDYRAWRREQARRYDEDYAAWKSDRRGTKRGF